LRGLSGLSGLSGSSTPNSDEYPSSTSSSQPSSRPVSARLVPLEKIEHHHHRHQSSPNQSHTHSHAHNYRALSPNTLTPIMDTLGHTDGHDFASSHITAKLFHPRSSSSPSTVPVSSAGSGLEAVRTSRSSSRAASPSVNLTAGLPPISPPKHNLMAHH
jgi:hypothetical protein